MSRPKMIGITILNSHPSGGIKATYCPPILFRPSGSDPDTYSPYRSPAGTAARWYISRRHRCFPGLSPSCYLSGWDLSHAVPRAYSSSPSYWRSSYEPCSYEYLSNCSQGYDNPSAHKYLLKGYQNSNDPYGLEYLYSYRRRYCDPCDHGYSPSYDRRYCDPCVYNDPPSYGRSCYPSRGYTYRCGYSNDPCGYSCAPGYRQPLYADRRRYSSRPVSRDPYRASSGLPCAPDCASYCGPC